MSYKDNRSWFERKTAKILNFLVRKLCPNTLILNDGLHPYYKFSIEKGDRVATSMAGHWLIRQTIDSGSTKLTLTYEGLTIDEPSGRVKYGDWEVIARRIN